MTNPANTKTSKFLSFVLRHNPDAIGLTLDSAGWASVDELITCAANDGKTLTRDHIREVVETNNKQRFILSDDGNRIRANQGHSIKIELGLEAVDPPEMLYHGTATRFLDSIQREGLQPRNRHHVHLSKEIETAINVGSRHGKPVVLQIDARKMASDGCEFFCSANGVWLTDEVPPRYFSVIGE